jgi:predicted Zn-dependent protease
MRRTRYALAGFCAALAWGCAVSVQRELTLGQRYAALLEKEMEIVHAPAIESDLRLIAARLTPFSARPEITYRFFLVNSDAVNAFAVPGGYIYVTRALVENAVTLDQLAGVLGHEMAHVELRHSAEQLGRAEAAEAGLGIASVLLGRSPNQTVQAGVQVAGQLVFAKFSRDQEREADVAAVSYVTRARINPAGLTGMFRVLQGLERARPSAIESFFASHPMTAERIEEVTALIARDSVAARLLETGETDAPEFRRLKAAVSALPPPRDREARPGARR